MTIPCRLGWNQLYGTDTCFAVFSADGSFMVNKTSLSFNQARENCLNRSSDLVRIDSNAANDQVFEKKNLRTKKQNTVCKVSAESLLRNNFIFNVRMIVCGCVGVSRDAASLQH